MNSWKLAFWLMLSTIGLSPVIEGETTLPNPRGVRVAAIVHHAEGFEPKESAGVFIGIQNFSQEQRLTTVDYAVDDAVDLAHLFSLELGLIPPNRVRLAISGDPEKEDSKRRLQALLDSGTPEQRLTDLADVLTALEEGRFLASRRGIFLVTISSHGFSSGGLPSLTTSDTVFNHMEKTSLETDRILKIARDSKATRRLLFIDACQEQTRSISNGTELSKSFLRAVAAAKGEILLIASAYGGLAYSDRQRRNGVFTSAVIDGLHCGAKTDSSGFVTAGALASFVNQEVVDWTTNSRPDEPVVGIQKTFDGAAASLPLADCLQTNDSGKNLASTPTLSVLVTLQIRSSGQMLTVEKTVRKEQDVHDDVFLPHTHSYSIVYPARPGYRIVEASFKAKIRQGVSSLKPTVSRYGTEARLDFTLTSGPKKDPYPARLHGFFVLKQQRSGAQSSLKTQINLNTRRFGNYPLEISSLPRSAAISKVTVQDSEGNILAQGAASRRLTSADRAFEFTLLKLKKGWALRFLPNTGQVTQERPPTSDHSGLTRQGLRRSSFRAPATAKP